MAISIKPNNDNVSGTIQVGGIDRLVLNSDSTITSAASPTFADIATKKLTTMDQFTALRSANGYKKDPSGIIDQWFSATVTAIGTVVNFPISFTTVSFPVMACNGNGSGTTGTIGVGTPSLTGVSISMVGGGVVNVRVTGY